MDILNPEQRRKAMQGNKATGTKIEVLLGKAMWAQGLRYRKNNRKIIGTPDFTFAKYKVAVFADGDFWHGKDWEKRRNKVGANAGFWYDKIERNIERDYKVTKQLCENGWTVLRFWETEIRQDADECARKVKAAIDLAKEKIAEEKRLSKIYHKKISIPNECEKNVVQEFLSTETELKKRALKKKAAKKMKTLLQYKYPEENITMAVAEDVLKYAVRKEK
ncbi:very short patch repair endonuclease [Cruoricaptor ignavus]|uniref:Very short patch repair endonuclease n=1 Tax=Cruoricaptor ignavus TaxID=1118202 RepID=A0A7M1T2R3_9FLAO|nr:very short patch repair endonuclease [Cruoricaptor ignavus]QOR74099.1 very short patch repair endonuclease [Cruoricaptor ignavus]